MYSRNFRAIGYPLKRLSCTSRCTLSPAATRAYFSRYPQSKYFHQDKNVSGMAKMDQTCSYSSVVSSVSYENIVVKENSDTGVALISLSRPKALNALCISLQTELVDALKKLDSDEKCRCIVITGAGEKAFAAGADIKEMSSIQYSDICKTDCFAKWEQISTIRKPIIAAVNGYALGGGCEIAMMADIIVASDKAKFGQPEVTIGTIPGMGGSQRLSRSVGKSKAMDMILTGDPIDAQEAKSIGLVSRVFPHETLMAETMKMAEKIASFSTAIIDAAKKAVNSSFETPLQVGLNHERALFYGTFATHDRAEGMSAFVGKRAPEWKDK